MLSEAYELFGCNTADLYVIAVNDGNTNAQCIQFDQQYGIDFPCISGVEGGGTAINNTYGIGAYPTYILIAPNHQIVEQDMWPIYNVGTFINYFQSNGIQQAECNPPPVPIGVDLKVFLEGPFFTNQMSSWLNIAGYLPLTQPYNAGPWNYSGTESVSAIPNANVIDWILVELRETDGAVINATSNTIVARQAAFLLNNGSIVSVDGSSKLYFNTEINTNLYAVIWHRNHLGIICAYPLTISEGVYSFDFTTGPDKVFGGALAQKQLGTEIWGMISGNGMSDDQLDNNDKDDIWNLQYGTVGYKSGDFNMNGQVNIDDKVIMWEPNSGNSSKVPQ